MGVEGPLQPDSTDLPLLPGLGAGALAFVVGYAVTFIVKSGDVASDLARAGGQFAGAGVSPPSQWQVIGWFFYQMHNVGIEVSITLAGQSQTRTFGGNVEAWLLLVPILVLLVTGIAVGMVADADTPRDGAMAGLTVTGGYFVLAVAVAVLTTWSASQGGGSISLGPSLIPAVILAGIVYPAVLGAAGGAGAGAVDV